MTGKYQSRVRFNMVRAQRWALRSLLRKLVRWEPLREPREGYTILIGCSSRYALMREARVEYLGSCWYGGNGVIHDDRLVGTPELMFDAQFVRARFKPIHLFNHVCLYKGRTVDFDTFLYPQTLAGRGQVAPISENCMVHPSQLICQFTAHMNERAYLPPTGNNLLLIPYFFSLPGDQESMRRQTDLLLEENGSSVLFHGRLLNLANLHKTHVDWITKQAYRLEEAVSGGVRPEVSRYFDAVARFVKHKDEAR